MDIKIIRKEYNEQYCLIDIVKDSNQHYEGKFYFDYKLIHTNSLIVNFSFYIDNIQIFAVEDNINVLYLKQIYDNWFNTNFASAKTVFNDEFHSGINYAIDNLKKNTIGWICRSTVIRSFIEVLLYNVTPKMLSNQYYRLYRQNIDNNYVYNSEDFINAYNRVLNSKNIKQVKNIINKYLRTISFVNDKIENITFLFKNYTIIVTNEIRLIDNNIKSYRILFINNNILDVKFNKQYSYYYICLRFNNDVISGCESDTLLYCSNNIGDMVDGIHDDYTKITYDNFSIIVSFFIDNMKNSYKHFYPGLLNNNNYIQISDDKYLSVTNQQLHQILKLLINVPMLKELNTLLLLMYKTVTSLSNNDKELLNKYIGNEIMKKIIHPIFSNNKVDIYSRRISYATLTRIFNRALYNQEHGIADKYRVISLGTGQLLFKVIPKQKLTKDDKKYIKLLLNNIRSDIKPFTIYKNEAETECFETENAYCFNHKQTKELDNAIVFIKTDDFGPLYIEKYSENFGKQYNIINTENQIKLKALQQLTQFS